ncbi:MAG: MFS transporter [Opitutaceae bacterium]|nr:MFS transporter [Opitutaceae bacterium]
MSAAPPPKENLLINIACNVVAPSVILAKFSKPEWLGPKPGLLIALSFPLAYGLYDLARRRNFNFLSALGFVSTLATGGLGLLKLPPFWFAVKEAVVPSLIGLTVIVSQWTRKPLVRSLLFNDQVIDTPRVEAALATHGRGSDFHQLLLRASWLLAGSFFLSALLNFGLARVIIKSLPDTPEFNEELGRMTLWSWPVIVFPSMAIMLFALWRLLKGLEGLSGLTVDEILRQPPPKS